MSNPTLTPAFRMSAHNGTVLQLAHPLLKEAVQSIANEPEIVIDCIISDYDNSQFHLVYPGSGDVTVSAMINGYTYFQKYVNLSEFKVIDTEANYSFTVVVPKDKVNLIPQMKMNLLGKVALQMYETNASILYPTQSSFINTQNNNIIISNYAGEFIFLKGEKERLTIIFKIVFENNSDDGFAKVFIQELIDARKLVGLQGTPQVMFNKDIPLELKSFTSGQANVGGFSSYVTFSVFPQHIQKNKVEQLAKILMFRNYLQYHIKCSKAYLHTRMRTKVGEWLKVLNRAKLDQLNAESGGARVTASGKTFRK